jgi:hypothetical protein
MSRCIHILARFGLQHIDTEWLDECVSYIDQNFPGQFEQELCRQLLYGDLQEFVAASPLSIISEQSKVAISQPLMVQIVNIQEIGLSGQQQVELIEQQKPIPRKTLKLTINDGEQQFFGVEMEPLNSLDLLTALGTKALLSFGTINRKHIILNNDNFKILGGEVSDLNPCPALSRIEEQYRTALGSLRFYIVYHAL